MIQIATPHITAVLGGVVGALVTLAATMGPFTFGPARAEAAEPVRYEYQMLSIDLVGRTMTQGDRTRRLTSGQNLDEALSTVTKQEGWRVSDVYTINGFGPFFLLERPAR